ncbi:30s ribosomal s17p [Fusarium longipes]|uniref:30s ribosomal s17p n=1 Tax=Fusarium longipes TaxID=694270 RepID=A0A395T0P5_9HYPO|nr:30s ribosomal s17p [Fusarium longipes]
MASETTPRADVNWAPRLSNLAARLGERHSRIGRMIDLDEAIRIGYDLTRLTDPIQTNQSVYLNNLAIRSNDRYGRTGLLSDLETAIWHSQKSVDMLPASHADLSARLKNLGSFLNERYRRTKGDTDYRKAMDVANAVLNAAADGGPSHPACLSSKGILLLSRFAVKRRLEDLVESIGLLRKAVELSPESHAQRADRQRYLGDALHEMFKRDNDFQTLDEAISLHRAAMTQANAPLLVRMRASRHLLQDLVTKGTWEEAYEASKDAFGLVPQLILRSLDNSDKQYLLTQVAGLACEATSIAIRAGKSPMTAIKILEQGRGILATSIKDMRTDLKDLEEEYPELAVRFAQSKEELKRLGGTTEASDSAQVSRQYKLEEHFNNILAEIRTKEGFQDFLLAPSAQRIRTCAKNGTVIIINVSMFQCDAIILKNQSEEYLRLPEVSQTKIERRAQSGRINTIETLEWMWDAIAKPIFDNLSITHGPQTGNWPRIWWIPTGSLSRFPLHAAGYHLRGTNETVLDRTMSSYSSSIRAMCQGEDAPLQQPSTLKALLMSAENGDPGRHLPSARREISVIRQICHTMDFEVVEPGTSKTEVKSHLKECKVFHFAGHGFTDPSNPSESHLKLGGKDGSLTVGEMMDLNLSKDPPFLAYLSACETGRFKDVRYADESLHLIGACQISGFRNVIGTLWEVQDDLCVDVAAGVYRSILDRGLTDGAICQGLHEAVRAMRLAWMEKRGKRRQRHAYRADYQPEQVTDRAIPTTSGKNYLDLRAILPVEEGDEEKLQWIPYVHFGN